jgi:hypothetical protein
MPKVDACSDRSHLRFAKVFAIGGDKEDTAIAPAIAWFYGEPRLTSITLVSASVYIRGATLLQRRFLKRCASGIGSHALRGVMKYHAHYSHKDFILCLGYKADVIKNYFLNYNECISNDFTLLEKGKKLQ